MADNRPAAVPSWADDTNFSSGPKTGSPTKIEPSSGAKAQGDVPGQPYRSERHNWLWNLLCGWVFYLSDLHNQTQFLNKAYTWVGNHVFSGTIAINGGGTMDVGDRIDWSGGTHTTTVSIPLAPSGPIAYGTSSEIAGGGEARFYTVIGDEHWDVKGAGSPSFNGAILCFPVPAGLLKLNNTMITSFSFVCDPNANDVTCELIEVGTFGGSVGSATRAGGLGQGNTTYVVPSPSFTGLGYYYFNVSFGSDNATYAKLYSISLTFSSLSAVA